MFLFCYFHYLFSLNLAKSLNSCVISQIKSTPIKGLTAVKYNPIGSRDPSKRNITLVYDQEMLLGANVKDYKLIELPKQTSPFDKWLGKVEKDAEARIMERNLGVIYPFFKQLHSVISLKGVQARLPFDMLIE
jgi:hypothetical protein